MEEMQPGRIISPTPQNDPSTLPDGQQPQRAPQQETSVVTAAAEDIHNFVQPKQSEVAPDVREPQLSSPRTALGSPALQPVSSSSRPINAPIGSSTQEPSLEWSAAEYVHNEKHLLWYGLYILGTLLLSAVVYITTKDIMSTGIVFVAILGLVFFASRKPGIQKYTIDGDSLRVGQKVYYLNDFKAFSVIEEGAMVEITLRPLKRFLPMVSVYVSSEQVDDLGDHLADFLPFEPYKPDAVDTLLRRIRF